MRLSTTTIHAIQKISLDLFNAVVRKEGKTENLLAGASSALFLEDTKNWDEDFAQISTEVITSLLPAVKATKVFSSWEDLVRAEVNGERFVKQILHYLSTYGTATIKEMVGTTTEEVERKFSGLMIIKVISEKEFKEKLIAFVETQATIESEHAKQIVLLFKAYFSKDEVPTSIASREVKTLMILNGLREPESPTEALKAIYIRITGSSLYVKSFENVKAVRRFNPLEEDTLNFINLFNKFSEVEWANIFNRERSIFLALKKDAHTDGEKVLARKINRISKMAKKLPTKNPILSPYKRLAELSVAAFAETANGMDLPYLVKVFSFISNKEEFSLIKIRNGKIWYKKTSVKIVNKAKKIEILKVLLSKRISENAIKLDLKLPSSAIEYAVPTSGKQFVGDIPVGSSVKVPKGDLSVMIEWGESKDPAVGKYVDLDLSAVALGQKIGWNSSWATASIGCELGDAPTKVLYSGDITAIASDSDTAAEVIRVSSEIGGIDAPAIIFKVNNFRAGSDFKLFISNQDISVDKETGISDIDLDKMLLMAPMTIKSAEMMLGFIKKDTFYFSDWALSQSRVSEDGTSVNVDGETVDLAEILAGHFKNVLKFSDLDIVWGSKEASSKAELLALVN